MQKDHDFLSDKISTQVRTIAIGIIAFVWLLLIGDQANHLVNDSAVRTQLVFIGAGALLAMFLDYLQYAVGYLYSNALLVKGDKTKDVNLTYDISDWRYKFRRHFFWAKQGVIVGAVVWLTLLLLFKLICN